MDKKTRTTSTGAGRKRKAKIEDQSPASTEMPRLAVLAPETAEHPNLASMLEGAGMMYSQTTGSIRVSVSPEYIDEHSDPTRNIYVFAYTVRIENLGDVTVQLLRRRWVVNSGGSLYTEVMGDGVVGEQPVLEAGDVFEYTSSSVIKDPVGSQHGTYTFRADSAGATEERSDEEPATFEVSIPEFDLVHPGSVH